MPPSFTPEEQARVDIDRQLKACGWQVQSRKQLHPPAATGVVG